MNEKTITLTLSEIVFLVKILKTNIDYAPEENTQEEIENYNTLIKKLIL